MVLAVVSLIAIGVEKDRFNERANVLLDIQTPFWLWPMLCAVSAAAFVPSLWVLIEGVTWVIKIVRGKGQAVCLIRWRSKINPSTRGLRLIPWDSRIEELISSEAT